jgi:hypothetical protein
MITFSEIQDAFLFVSSAQYGMHSAILCKDSGRIYYRSEAVDFDEIEEELDCDTFIEIPHKNDLDLGRNLVFEFVELHLADEMIYVQRIFHGSGAYGRFKDLLEQKGMLQRWYDFENLREEEALRQWCTENEISVGQTELTRPKD